MAVLTKPVDPSKVYDTLALAQAAYGIGDTYTRTVQMVTKSGNNNVTTNYTYTQTVFRYSQDMHGKWHVECTETKTKQT